MIRIHQAMWSASASQRLNGFDDDSEFFQTRLVFATDKPDVYRQDDGQEIHVVSWQPDGRGYRDEKK